MNARDRYVVDASVAVKWVIPEPSSGAATLLLEATVRGEIDVFVPDVFVAEVTNVIWKWSQRNPDVSAEQANTALAELLEVLPTLIPSQSLAQQALELALRFKHPAYDCLYVALALRDHATLVTADQRLMNALGPATGRLVHIDDLELP